MKCHWWTLSLPMTVETRSSNNAIMNLNESEFSKEYFSSSETEFLEQKHWGCLSPHLFHLRFQRSQRLIRQTITSHEHSICNRWFMKKNAFLKRGQSPAGLCGRPCVITLINRTIIIMITCSNCNEYFDLSTIFDLFSICFHHNRPLPLSQWKSYQQCWK